MDYTGIIILAAFLVAVQIATRTNSHPLIPATVAAIVPYLVTLCTKFIYALGYELPILPNLFSFSSILIVLIQFVVSVYLFKKIRDEDSLILTTAWCIGGFFAIVFAVPYFVGLVGI